MPILSSALLNPAHEGTSHHIKKEGKNKNACAILNNFEFLRVEDCVEHWLNGFLTISRMDAQKARLQRRNDFLLTLKFSLINKKGQKQKDNQPEELLLPIGCPFV